MHARTTAGDLARWLAQQGGHWHVEGEPALSKSLPLPTPASSLVDVLTRRDGELAMLLPDASSLVADASLSPAEIANAAHLVDGARVFQLAWIEDSGELRDSWLLCEQRGVRGSYPDDDAATQVIAAFRSRAKSL